MWRSSGSGSPFLWTAASGIAVRSTGLIRRRMRSSGRTSSIATLRATDGSMPLFGEVAGRSSALGRRVSGRCCGPCPRRPGWRAGAALTAVDLFCGVGGLSVGLKDAGFSVLGAVDVSGLALEGYRENHPGTTVWHQNIRSLPPKTMMKTLGLVPGQLDLLAGCPPCQGFSTMRTLRRGTSVADKRNSLVAQFGRYASVLQPRALMMENVPGLAEEAVLDRLVKRLEGLGYAITTGVHDAADFGVPQRRKRFVLVGIRNGERIDFAEPVSPRRTVRDALGNVPTPTESDDPLHIHGEQRTRRIRNLIAAIPPDGGGRKDLPRRRQLGCHKRTNGFFDVYGRMAGISPLRPSRAGASTRLRAASSIRRKTGR